MTHIRRFKPWLTLSALLLLTDSPVSAQAPGVTGPNAKAAEATVRAYVRAWCAGDLHAMYEMWDARSRHMITLPQLETAFTRHPPVTGGRASAAKTVVVGRPLAFVGDHTKAVTDHSATVDCVARFTFQSVGGYPLSALRPNLIRKIKKDPAVFFIAVAAMEAPCSTVDGDTEVMIHGQGASNLLPPPSFAAGVGHKPPFVTLYFHRYVLTREGNGWKITNAVTVSDHLASGKRQ
jgi:hypothetical protein